MSNKTLKVLLIVEQCNRGWASVHVEGYNYLRGINNLVEATLVTHIRNKPALEKHPQYEKNIYFEEIKFSQQYYKMVEKLMTKRRVNLPFYNALSHQIYEEFNQQVY